MQCSFTYIPVSCPSTSAMLDTYMHGDFDIPNRTMNTIDYCIQMKLVAGLCTPMATCRL